MHNFLKKRLVILNARVNRALGITRRLLKKLKIFLKIKSIFFIIGYNQLFTVKKGKNKSDS